MNLINSYVFSQGPRRNIFLGGRNFVKKGICETTGAKRLQTNKTSFSSGIRGGAPKNFEFWRLHSPIILYFDTIFGYFL